MEMNDRIELFSEQVMCGADIYTWIYNEELSEYVTNCPEDVAPYLDAALNAFGGKENLHMYALEENRPTVLSVPIGLSWAATISRHEEGVFIYVIGPVWNSGTGMKTSFGTMEEMQRERNIDREWLKQMSNVTRSLPVVMPALFNQYALMLYCTVTGEKQGLSDLLFRKSKGTTEKEDTGTADRYRIWRTEQRMLQMVREGDMGFARAFNEAGALSEGVHLEGGDTLRKAKTSVIVFTTLCTRAAIEGGLSPEEAYSLGDKYISSVENSRQIAEIGALSYGMYTDFVKRVRDKKMHLVTSAHIRAVCDYIEIHAEEPFTNKDLARRAGYSEQYLRRKFTLETGISLPEYIKNVRIRRAKDMLLHSDLTIPEIAEQLQFCSRGHFSEVFEKTVGESPAKFRKRKI